MNPTTKTILMLLTLAAISPAQPSNPEIPRDTSFSIASTYEKISKAYPEAIPVRDVVPDGVAAYRDLVYATLLDTPYGKRELHLDLFRPQKKGRLPAMLLIHGGGWRSGDKSLQVPMAERLAVRGFVTVCVEYQLSLEAKYPAALHNIKAALRWVRANADQFEIDPNRIAISGCSAGGQLALLAGLTSGIGDKEGKQGHAGYSSAVQAIIDIDGLVDFMAPMSLNLKRATNSPDIEWLGGSFAEKPEVWRDASPIFWANENSPPVLFINSGFSRFHAGQDELIGMMKEWGIYTETRKFEVQVHPFWLFEPWMPQTVDYMEAFLRRTLPESRIGP